MLVCELLAVGDRVTSLGRFVIQTRSNGFVSSNFSSVRIVVYFESGERTCFRRERASDGVTKCRDGSIRRFGADDDGDAR